MVLDNNGYYHTFMYTKMYTVVNNSHSSAY